METPATIRRNPPRKAKLTSTEKSTVKEYGSARKPYVAQGKALMPSFVTADGNRKLKLTEEATRIETLQPGPPFPRNTEIPIVIGNGMACNPQYMESLHGKSACGRESNKFDNSTPKSSNAAGQQCSITNSVEKILTSGIVGSKIENPVCEAPSWRQFEKLASNKVSVFLRIRPAEVVRIGNGHKRKASELANRSSQQGLCPSAETRSTVGVPNVCLQCQAPDRVHLITPSMYSALHKPKEEEFNGFSRVFYPESTQIDVFDEVLAPRLADLLEGESSLVVAMGPTGAGKTHTMLGSHGDPGLVPQSLRYLFASQKSKTVSTSMKIIISMFEIYSEQGGRPEKIFDLLQDGAELILQQTKIKCLHEPVSVPILQAPPMDLLTAYEKPKPYKEGSAAVRFDTFRGFEDRTKTISFLQQFDVAFVGGNFTEPFKVRKAASFLKGNASQWWNTLLLKRHAPITWIL
ncbi:hypothetical protein L7F22_023547 [Adiantum nelumboides]|nr:hypothetical protein [Adiantum nelumboides]